MILFLITSILLMKLLAIANKGLGSSAIGRLLVWHDGRTAVMIGALRDTLLVVYLAVKRMFLKIMLP